MKRRTTTRQLSSAISNNLLILTKAEVYHKTSRKTEIIDNDALIENLLFLCESGYFADCVGWTYSKDCKTNSYIAECSRTDGNAENIITLYLGVGDDVDVEDINKALTMVEETENFAEKI